MPNPIQIRRLIKPPGGIQMNPVVSSWATRVVANGGGAPSAATKTAINTFYNGLVTDGIDGLIIAMNVFAPDNLTAAITPLVVGPGSDPWTNNGFLAGDLSTAGLASDTTKDLGLGLTATTAYATNNEYGMFVYCRGTGGNPPHPLCTAQNGGTSSYGYLYDSSEMVWGTVGFQEWLVADAQASATYYFQGMTRTAANAAAAYIANGALPFNTVGTTAVAPSPRLNYQLHLNARNINNGSIDSRANNIYSFFCLTHGATAAQVQKLFNRTQTLRTTFGGGFS